MAKISLLPIDVETPHLDPSSFQPPQNLNNGNYLLKFIP